MKIGIGAWAVLVALVLNGCEGSGGGGSAPTATAAARIALHVFSDDGPVDRARISVEDVGGKEVAAAELTGEPRVYVSVPAGARYPLIVKANPADGSAALKAAVINSLVTEQDVSPVTTLVVDAALSFGGLTEQNLAKAAGAAISQRRTSGGSGTSSGFKGDPTKQYGGWH
jgi:hypothetical protein